MGTLSGVRTCTLNFFFLIAESVRLTLLPKKKPKKKLKWSEDTIDNENMGKKKSKKCCIFHKKKRFDESSSDESSSESEGEEGHVCGDDCVHKEFSLFDAMPPDIRKDFEPSS